jgi:SAM-dependent methyltransferase
MPESFVDEHGVSHVLDPRHRDRLKPAWRSMLDPEQAAQLPSDAELHARAARAVRMVDEAMALIEAVTGGRLAGAILEIGCYDGSVAFQLARVTHGRIVASDMAGYYVAQRPGEPGAALVVEQRAALARLRERARRTAGAARGVVEFVEDDITVSGLEHGAFDSIVSFEVLEHLADPVASFAAMRQLLRPAGIGYHLYNPFVSINGGHSLCTLDFPWGHARLSAPDVERYVREIRPDAAAQTLRFYYQSLNRMTLADLRAAVAAAGLELLAVLPWADRSLTPRLSDSVLDDVRRVYPSATVTDLLATFVAIVIRRPDEPRPDSSSVTSR